MGEGTLSMDKIVESDLCFEEKIKTIATDSHFLVPLCVLVLGIALMRRQVLPAAAI
jgi:hypothetical protein